MSDESQPPVDSASASDERPAVATSATEAEKPPFRRGRQDPKNKLKQALLRRRIVEHWYEYGDAEWEVLREAPDLIDFVGAAMGKTGRRRFDRAREKALGRTPPDITRPHEGREAQDLNREKAARIVSERRSAGLPASEAEAYWARHGKGGERRINLASEISSMFDDVELARKACVATDAEGRESAIDPKGLLAAKREKERLVRLSVEINRDLAVIQSQQQMIEGVCALIDEVVADPQVRQQLRSRLPGCLLVENGQITLKATNGN